MKKGYLLIVLSTFCIDLYAQNFVWGKREGLWAYDYGYGIVNDNSGNIYVTGKYEDAALFSGTTLTNVGNHDMFLAKYTSAGTIDWIKTAGGNLGDYSHAIAIDGSNNLIVTGEIEGYGNLISFQGSSVTLNCIGDNDIFLAKYDMNGNLLWAKGEGYNYSEKGLGTAFDPSGNIYICGYFNDTTYFNSTMMTGYGMNDIFLAKYDANGNFQWIKKAGSPGRDEAKAVKCDAAGNIYICGMHSDGAVFGSQTFGSPLGYFNTFLAKYAPDGTLLWVKSAGGDYDDVAWSLTLDNAGKIYITGEFNAYALFDALPLTTSGEADIFVACYDAAGTVQWVKGAGGNTIDRARGIGCDGTNIFITGQFGNTVSFDSYSLTAADSSDVFIASLNNSGNFAWATAVGGQSDSLEFLGYESGNAICAEASGNVYATGAILDGGVFGSASSCTEYGRTDVFVARLAPVGVNVPEANFEGNIHIYPNPVTSYFTVDIGRLSNQKTEITLFNCLGQVIDKKIPASSPIVNFNLSEQENGIYFIEVKTENEKTKREKVILNK